MLDRRHGCGEAARLFLIVQNLAADVGMKPDLVIHSWMIGCALNVYGMAVLVIFCC
jgi:hypothetical protein